MPGTSDTKGVGFPHQAIIQFSVITGCPTIPFHSDTIYPELAQTPQGKGSDCPHLRHQPQAVGPQVAHTSVHFGYKLGVLMTPFSSLMKLNEMSRGICGYL